MVGHGKRASAARARAKAEGPGAGPESMRVVGLTPFSPQGPAQRH